MAASFPPLDLYASPFILHFSLNDPSNDLLPLATEPHTPLGPLTLFDKNLAFFAWEKTGLHNPKSRSEGTLHRTLFVASHVLNPFFNLEITPRDVNQQFLVIKTTKTDPVIKGKPGQKIIINNLSASQTAHLLVVSLLPSKDGAYTFSLSERVHSACFLKLQCAPVIPRIGVSYASLHALFIKATTSSNPNVRERCSEMIILAVTRLRFFE